MDSLQSNTTPIAQALCVSGKKLWRWYRDSLSGFLESDTQKDHHRYDFEVNEKGVKQEVRVPILKEENIGPNMAIDEKQIGEEMHTIVTNRDTGKIALMARTMKSKELAALITHFNGKGFGVKTLTRDLSPGYDWYGRQAFPNAGHIADKFHIISSLLDAQQDVRVRYRQELLRERRMLFEAHKQKEKQREKECREKNIPCQKKEFQHKEEKLSNGETPLELLARGRYLLYKYQNDWTPSQAERAKVLFNKYPQIQKAHQLACSFRNWYKKENVGKDIPHIEHQLDQWFQQVDKEDIDEICNFKSLVERNKTVITSYFIAGHTNAIAENMNSKISRFVMINQGTRDREFFYFRLAKYFS